MKSINFYFISNDYLKKENEELKQFIEKDTVKLLDKYNGNRFELLKKGK